MNQDSAEYAALIRTHERNWHAVADALKEHLPGACLAGVDIDANSEAVIEAIDHLRKATINQAIDIMRRGHIELRTREDVLEELRELRG